MVKKEGRWPIELIPVEKLILDPQNYRLDAPGNASQEYLREQLFEHWNVIDLARGIANHGDLMQSDNVVVTPDAADKEKYIVLEGNRRLCAIQCIINQDLIPEKFRKRFVKRVTGIDADLIENLSNIYSTISPDRESAEGLITARHTDYAIKKWPHLTQDRRVYDAYSKLGTVPKTASQLGLSDKDAEGSIQTYSLFSHIRKLKYWDEDEAAIISLNDLDVTTFTRNLTSKAISRIGYKFDSDQIVISESDSELTDFLLYKMAQAAFIKGTHKKIDTRSEEPYILELLNKYEEEFNKEKSQKELEEKEIESNSVDGDNGTNITEPQGNKDDTENPPRNGGNIVEIHDGDEEPSVGGNEEDLKQESPATYFEGLKCSVKEQRLKKITAELVRLSKPKTMEKFPVSGTMLSRALLESCLRYQVKKHKKMGEYVKSLEHSKDGKITKSPEGLKNLVTFVLKNVDVLFRESNRSNARKTLEEILSHRLEYMNGIVHESWFDPTPGKVQDFAGDIREMLRFILSDTA